VRSAASSCLAKQFLYSIYPSHFFLAPTVGAKDKILEGLRAWISATSLIYPQKCTEQRRCVSINPLNPELNPICYLLALLGAHHFLHVSRIRVKLLTFRLLMSYVYMEHPFLMFLDHTQRRSTVGRTPLDE